MKNLLKKALVICILATAILAISPITPAFADGFTGRTGNDCQGFLGLTSWDCNVNINDEASLSSGIWTIVANVFTDITVITAYLILGYIIYGGYLYIFSGGDPGKVATGKKTLNQAFIGFAIVISANIILNTIRIVLIQNGSLINCATTSCADPSSMAQSAINWIIAISGVVCVIFVVGGGIQYTTSAGDPNKLQKAKNMILYALIGLAIVALAEIITVFISNTVRSAEEAALINPRKESYVNLQIT
ncbi:hypothetical protein IKG05_00870 [Candidatus Saccharibacteria bacterium]|nr:hypothetical protein [Candidatus Saccharibacteria bacterium]